MVWPDPHPSGAAPRRRTPMRRLVAEAIGHQIARSLPLAAAVTGVVALTALYLQSVTLYLTPDGAHYLADADAMVGDGVRGLRHAPLFPVLLVVVRSILDDAVAAVLVALGLALALLQIALYLLARSWVSPGPALLASGLATMSPITAELLGWQGGATLVGVAGVALSVAAMERWVDGHPWGGGLTGAALGVTSLAHPFLLAVAAWCVALRWVVHVSAPRRRSRGWGPTGVRGIVTALVTFSVFLAAALPVYRRLHGGGTFGLQVPRLEAVTSLLGWATGGTLAVALLVVAVLAAVAFRSPGPLSAVVAIGTVLVVMGATLNASTDYVSRITYVLPVAVVAGLAAAFHLVRDPFHAVRSRRVRPWTAAAILVVALVAGVAFGGYGPRIERAASYYQWLQPEDVEVLEGLAERPGTVATSWRGNEYGTGVSTSWYIEGLARRAAFGPTAPSMSMIPEQVRAGAATQQLFAGAEGLQNGALQVATGPSGTHADPTIQVRSAGFYHPLLFADALVNEYPVALPGPARRVVGEGGISVVHRDGGEDVMRHDLRLDGRRVAMTYELAGPAQAGDWDLYLWPAYGFPWTDAVTFGVDTVAAEVELPDETVELAIASPGAEVTPVTQDRRYGMPAVRVRAQDADSVTITVDVTARSRPGVTESFDQRAIIDRHDITDVLLLKDTGWRARFDRDDCYRPGEETDSLLVYRVRQHCMSRPAGA